MEPATVLHLPVVAVMQAAKDPYCCLSDKMRIVSQAFDRGALTSLRTLKYAARQLSRDDLLWLIDSQIADLESRTDDDN